MEEKFNLVRNILRSPAFNSGTMEDSQNILDQIVATGEVSKEDLFKILQEELEVKDQSSLNKEAYSPEDISYLESLPYEVFIKLAENLDGKDLINLCKASPLINEKCNKPFIIEYSADEDSSQNRGDSKEYKEGISEMNKEDGSGNRIKQVLIHQYLFYLLLKKMKIDLTFNDGFRKLYIWLTTTNNGNAFLKLNNRLQKLRALEALVEIPPIRIGYGLFPDDLLKLLYLGPRFEILIDDFENIGSIAFLSKTHYLYSNVQALSAIRDIAWITENIIKILYEIKYNLDSFLHKEDYDRLGNLAEIQQTLNESELDPVKFSQILGIPILPLLKRNNHFHLYFLTSIQHNKLDQIEEIASNFSKYYAKSHLSWVSYDLSQLLIPKIIDSYNIEINEILDHLDYYIEEDKLLDFDSELRKPDLSDYYRNQIEERRKLQNPVYAHNLRKELIQLKDLTKEEVEYLIKLHLAIWEGKIRVTTKFLAGDLMRLDKLLNKD